MFSFSAGTSFRAKGPAFGQPKGPDNDPVSPEKNSGPISRFAGFPLGPVLTALIVLVFSLIILNWESPALTLLLQGPAALDLHGEDEDMRDLAAYAGLSPMAAPAPAEEDIPLDLVEGFSWKTYQVKKGDSVSKIAAEHAISIDAIIASNGISNARRLQVGETLRIPNMDGIPYTVKNGDTLSKISIAMGVPLEAILDANDIQSDTINQGIQLFIPGAHMKQEDLKLALGELFIYPVRGRLTSPFGWRNDPISGVRRHHAALDLAASMGTPVKASMDGKVSSVGYNSVYGKYIIISHGNGFQSMYAHLSLTSVKQGAAVTQGSKIGEVGSTGYSTGPHLHFAVYKNGRAVNPLELLNQ
ncbi:peptidoglycan-binding protein LysM [Spirochaetia bacterium]|nr:peptidoglycan-binding protein LysM [Spirochaetia bacterium]